MKDASVKILVADDEQVILDLFSQILNSVGVNPICAKNGEEALEAYKREKPQIVFSDINMPKMNGIQLLKEIRKLRKDACVVLFTGYDRYNRMIAELKDKPDVYLRKPFRVDDIVKIVYKHFPHLEGN